MKWQLRLSAAAVVLAALAGCSDDDGGIIKEKGSYAPIITGITNHTGNPAVRGIPNEFEVHVTNVNNLALDVHWTATAGVLSDSTGLTAVWTPPDGIRTDTLTVSLTASDEKQSFFKTVTYPVFVENEYERWTRSDAVQFDVAPSTNGALLYAEFRNNLTGEGDVYRVATPMGAPQRLTQDFYSVSSPTPRADEQQVAFAARRSAADSTAIWLMPWGGADTLTATRYIFYNQFHTYMAHPRFAWNGGFLMYATDSGAVTYPKLSYRDVMNPVAPVAIIQNNPFSAPNILLNSYLPANWGPGGSASTPPDSIVTPSYFLYNKFGQTNRGAFKFRTPGFADPPATSDAAWIADSTIAEPDWSSDGQYICFSRKALGASDRDIWIIATNATSFAEAKQVTRGPADDSHPRFARDGQSIFFVSNRQDNYGLNGLFATERRGTNLWRVSRYDVP
ncbi:MAG TPA: hypothetical protein VFM17_06500 [Candidatus Eisenbacteria bacterium]|nr:hypothetical protein [Candidatus Eisenbacteria bacterium]